MNSVSATGNNTDFSLPITSSAPLPTASHQTGSSFPSSNISNNLVILEPSVFSNSSFSTITPTESPVIGGPVGPAEGAGIEPGNTQTIPQPATPGPATPGPATPGPATPRPATPASLESSNSTAFSHLINNQQKELKLEQQMAQNVEANNQALDHSNQHIKGIGEYYVV